jgi:arylsulfatase A-like enzyme
MKHILLSPTDQTGATFEIAEVRLVTRKEHLARIPSGIGWHGLSEIYRESLVTRSPESIEFALHLPPDPWLDLHLGTLDGGAVTFGINVSSGGADQTLLKRTITTAQRWEKAHIDLAEFSGQHVQVRLSLASEKDGMIGFWGSPVVRSRTARSPQAVHPPDELVSQASTKKPQGVILIQADTLRKDHLDLYGYSRVTAPILSKMAGKGAVFMDNVSQATWTKVSTPSIMTSLYPGSHGVSEFNDLLPASATTLAEIYREAGYATVSYSSVLFTGQFSNLHQGFEELHESSSVSDTDSSKTAREFVDRMLAWLDDHKETPFFAFLHVFDPHDPYEPYSPYNTIWANPEKKDEHTKNVEKAREVIEDPLMKQFAMPNRAELLKAGLDPEEYVSNDVDWYDGSIRGLDVEIGRLLEHLENLGLDESTVIAFTSDHGEEFLDHDRMFHGQSVYGELAGVPLVLYQKGVIPSGTVVENTVESIDLMPTLLELSHLPVPEGLQGESLLSYLVPDERAEAGSSVAFASLPGRSRPAFIEKAATKHAGGPPPRDTESSAVILDGWKLIHNTKRPDGVSEYELYNHSEDPLDQTDVAQEHPDVVERLSKELDKWRETVSANQLPKASSSEGLSPEELQRLRSLGYIQ